MNFEKAQNSKTQTLNLKNVQKSTSYRKFIFLFAFFIVAVVCFLLWFYWTPSNQKAGFSKTVEEQTQTENVANTNVSKSSNIEMQRKLEQATRIDPEPNVVAATALVVGNAASSISRLLASNPLNPEGLAASLMAENIISGEAKLKNTDFDNQEFNLQNYEFTGNKLSGVYRFAYSVIEPKASINENKILQSVEVVFGISPQNIKPGSSVSAFENLTSQTLESLNTSGGQKWKALHATNTHVTYINDKKESLWLKLYSSSDLPDNLQDPFNSVILGYTPPND